MHRQEPTARVRRGLRALPVLLLVLACGVAVSPSGLAQPPNDDEGPTLHLVTFDGPGTAGRDDATTAADPDPLLGRQEAALAAVGAPEPAYRWTTALNGVAVALTEDQAADLRAQPGVAVVEENRVRPLAGVAAAPAAPRARLRGRGGTGVVVGVIDTGIWPESPLFADTPALSRRPVRFSGSCGAAEDWTPGICNAKLVAARWFVRGFGEDGIAADEPLSARDVRGHGTQVASIAAANSDVSIGVPGLPASYTGMAPRASVAAYKACWSAPDPTDDGCSTADLVAAVDAATRDRVDVLNLSVSGAHEVDTLERALLGAAESGTVVMAAAGTLSGPTEYATHVSPWVTTVGALRSREHVGAVSFGDGRPLTGVMTRRRPVTASGVDARSIAAEGSSPAQAGRCTPGSLDASRAAGRVVVCERGSVARISKSEAVSRAGGVGMVLVNARRGGLGHDLHALPTVHLDRAAGSRLTRWLARNPGADLTLSPRADRGGRQRVARSSPAGDPGGTTLKPDLVAEGTGVLAGLPPTVTGTRWGYLTGTSAATAWASGAAASLVARHDWSAPVVRSVLATSGRARRDSVLRVGAGRPRPARAGRARLAHDVAPGGYRAWLGGRRDQVNTPSLLFRGTGTQRRRVTNVGGRTDTWQARVSGFDRYAVTVSPPAVTLEPGESATYRVTASGGSVVGGLDEGAVTWVAGDGARARVPVAIGR